MFLECSEENEQDIHIDITWKLCPNLSWGNGELKKYSIGVWPRSRHRLQRETLARCLTPSCWYSLPRGQKAELTLTMNLWMSVWKVFVKCMKNIWREWIPTAPLSHTISVSCLIFIDDLADLSCLVYRADTQTYQPYNKDWIKEKIYVLLCRQAQQAGK